LWCGRDRPALCAMLLFAVNKLRDVASGVSDRPDPSIRRPNSAFRATCPGLLMNPATHGCRWPDGPGGGREVPSCPCLCGRRSHGGPPRPRFSLIATPPISPHIMSRSGMEKVNSANFAFWGFSEVRIQGLDSPLWWRVYTRNRTWRSPIPAFLHPRPRQLEEIPL
jgi:hypothetical protein